MISAKLRHALDEFADALHRIRHPDDTDLQPEIAQQSADVVLDGDRLFLKQLARGQQRPSFLARQRLDVHRSEQVDPHHLRDAARIVAIALVHLRLQKRLGMPRLDADRRHACFRQSAEQPLRQRPGFETDTYKPPCGILKDRTRSSGWLATLRSRQILPASSTMHMDVSFTETSNPA